MRVLIATYLVPASPSGVVTYCQSLMNDLTQSGVETHLVDSSHMPVGWRKFIRGLRRLMMVGGIWSALYEELAYFIALYTATRKLRKTNVDLIHAQDVRSGVAAWLALGRRQPILLTCHFNDDPVQELALRFSLKSVSVRLLNRWYRYLFSFVKQYVFVSTYAYTQSKHLLPADLSKRILRNTVQLPEMTHPKPVNEGGFTNLIISNVGYIDERKNQQLLLQIGQQLRGQGIVDFQLWFIGDGPKRETYRQLAKELGLADQVTFFGRQQAPWQLVAQSDLYIHTALNDNCPYALVEALAVGTPVLALPVGGIPEMLPAGSGLLTGRTIAELTTEVAHFFDPEVRQQLRQTQAAFAGQHFNHRANLNSLRALYWQMVQQPAPITAQTDFAL